MKRTAAIISFSMALLLLCIAIVNWQSEYEGRDDHQKQAAVWMDKAEQARNASIGSHFSAEFDKLAAEDDAALKELNAKETAAEITYCVEAVVGAVFLIASLALWSRRKSA